MASCTNPFSLLPLDDDGSAADSLDSPDSPTGALDLPTDGPGADWRGLSRSKRLARSLNILLQFLGRKVGGAQLEEEEKREIGRLEFYQALWVQFYGGGDAPPSDEKKCVIALKNNVLINIHEFFDTLVQGGSFEEVTKYATERDLAWNIRRTKPKAKKLYLHPLLIEVRSHPH